MTYLLLVTMFAALNIVAPIASTKVAVLAGVTFATGSLLVGVSYGLLDVLNDWKGRKAARQTVEVALVVRVVFFALIVPVIVLLPTKSAPPGLDDFLAQSARLFAAGWASLFVGAWLVNTPFFSWLRERLGPRLFMGRYLTTSLPTIVAGSIVYGVLGFWGTKVDVWALIWGTITVRIAIAVIITPFAGALRWGVRRYAENAAW